MVELEEKEAELKKRGEQYQYLVENISDVIFVIDVKGTITYISPRVVPMTGYLEKDLEGQPYKGFVYPDDLEDVEIGLKSILEGINQPIFFRILDKDGKVRHIRVTGRPIMTGARVLGITGVASDVTEETLAKQELGEKEAQLRTFLANFGGVAYQVKIKPFRPVLYLGLVKEITGYTKEELLSGDITWDGIVLPEYIENLRKNRLKAEKAPGSSYSMLYRIRRKDGIIRWVYDIGQSLVLPGDGGLLIQGAIYDITDRKETEEEIRRAVQQITRNIEQMAILNDQIRNPLAVIVGLADMNPGELSDKILKQAEHINAIITELDRGWLDSEIVHEILRRHKYTLEEK